MNSTWTCAINHCSDQAWAIPVWQLLTPCVHKACVCCDRRYNSAHHHLTSSLPEWPRSTATHVYPYVICIATLTSSTHFFTKLLLKNFLISTWISNFLTYLSCISVRSTCRWWNLSSLKSWWAFPPSHGCNSHTWLPEDFPGYNFNRFHLSVILRCNKMWQTYVLLVLLWSHLWLSSQ